MTSSSSAPGWDARRLEWDARLMRVAPARDTSLRLGRDPSHPALGRRFRLGEPVRCAREGCHETFFFGVQCHVCPITAFCPEHQPAEVLRGWPSARRGRGPSDGTAREDDDPPPPGPRPYVAILSDDGARRVALACRACGHIQTRAGAPECGCAARWVVRVPGASVAQRFCVGCRRYHDLARFEDPDVPDHLRPRRACAWYRERLQHRVGDFNTAAPAPDPRDEDPSDDPSYPTDRFLAGAFSLFSAKFPARADDFAASEPRDAFVDGLLSHHARQELARQELARQSKRREGAHGGEGVRVRFIPANADASAAGTSDAATRTRRSERTAERTAAFASTSSFARTPSGSFVEPPPLDASGARFGYLSAIPGDAAPCVGMDAVDLPSFALARVDSRRAMERVLFAGATDARSERRARWTADDAPRTRARASAAAATEGARLVEPSSFSSLATSALEAGARVLASVEGVLLEATKDRDGVPQLRLMMGNPADPPPRGLPPGALLNGARAAVALVGRAGVRGSLARVVLRHVPGLDVDVRLRCRFAGHFLPVATVASRGFLLDRTRTVVEIDASPPRPGFAPLEGAAFLETVAIRGPAAGLPVGHPVPVLLTTDPGARDEMNAATKRAAEKSDSDAASRRVAWWLTCAMTAKTERACSREFVRRVVEYAWRAGAYRTLDALLRAHAHLPDADANVARTCDVAASGTSFLASLGDAAFAEFAESPEALARTLASLDWSDADDVDARSFRDRTFVRAVRSPPREGVSNRGEPASRRGEDRAAADSDVADSAIGHAFDEHVRHRRERQRERRRGRRRASRSETHLRWWDSAGVLILFTFSRVFDWRRPSHWLKVLMDGCFWRAREVFWDRATTRTRAAMREYRATGSTWAHELVMRRIVVLRTPHLCLTSVQSLFGSFLSPEWFDDRLGSAYAYRSVMLGRERAGVAPETVPEFLQRWVLFLIVITLAKMAHNVKLVRDADLADFTVKPASGFSYQVVNHFIVVHLCCVLRCVCLHGPLGWLRASAEEWLARAWWAAFIVADSLVAAGVLLCIAGRTRAGTRDRSVPFSFSRFVWDGEGTSDDERGWDDGVGRRGRGGGRGGG